jgi:hypothetical protein
LSTILTYFEYFKLHVRLPAETSQIVFQVTSNLDKVIENDVLIANTNQEQSYDISPYKGSDDEDEDEEEDDDVPNNKPIPSWARCVTQFRSLK